MAASSRLKTSRPSGVFIRSTAQLFRNSHISANCRSASSAVPGYISTQFLLATANQMQEQSPVPVSTSVSTSREYVRKRDGQRRRQYTIWILADLIPQLECVARATGQGCTKVLSEFAEDRLKRIKS